ncbi:MAG: hypothetical protein U5R14_05825 [Gemmatimonadota bacterium]|nr:hypothetical protein [Gemmatimonadota bacterium]
MRVSTGIYHDARSVTRAVRALLSASVPADSIRVVIREPSGAERDVPVRDEAGVLRGALTGGVIGAALGAVGMAVLTVSVSLSSGDGPLGADPLGSAIRGALTAAAAGVTLGALIGIGRWKGMPKLDRGALERGSAVVSVHSDALADTAVRVLSETGGEEVETTEAES